MPDRPWPHHCGNKQYQRQAAARAMICDGCMAAHRDVGRRNRRRSKLCVRGLGWPQAHRRPW